MASDTTASELLAPGHLIRPNVPNDWAAFRRTIASLYQTKSLKELMEDMERVHHFKAT
jgi:hypothetical protein